MATATTSSAAVEEPETGAAEPWSASSTRERIAGSPLVPGGVQWSADGRVAVVSDANVLIATFQSRELELFVRQGPAVSKSFVFLPEAARAAERVPVATPSLKEPAADRSMARAGGLTYLLLHETDRHQYNPKELSLSKNDGRAFLSATWGPRGSGPNASCALLTLAASSRIGLHFSSSFRMSWKEAGVISETLFDFFEKADFTMRQREKQSARDTGSATKKRRRSISSGIITAPTPATGVAGVSAGNESEGPPVSSSRTPVADYAHKCGLLSTLSIAWSPFVLTQDRETTSLVAFSGRKVATVWGYPYPNFASDKEPEGSFLTSAPMAWIDTEKYGWVSTSTWQQMRLDCSKPIDFLTLALGTTAGNVLLASVPVCSQLMMCGFPPEVAVSRTVLAPHSQPVFNIVLGSRDAHDEAKHNSLVVASGSTLSVWNVSQERPQPRCWKAHEGNITGLDINYFGDTIFSCGVDGAIKAWDKEKSTEIPYRSGKTLSGGRNSSSSEGNAKYPLFGLAVSPSSAQIACVHIIPPAARPNRKSQADVSYSRVSSALEYLPLPEAKDSESFVRAMCRVLEDSGSVSSFTDVLWFCYEDNAAITSLHGSTDMTIPNLLDKLRGVNEGNGDKTVRRPLYLSLCETLEQKYSALWAVTAEFERVGATTPRGIARQARAREGRSSLSAILYLQASYLLRSCIPPAEDHIEIRDEALAMLRRTLYGYWAERCLKELVATHSQVENFVGTTTSERISALLMADFLSVQTPLSATREQLVTTVYTRLGSEETQSRWLAYLQAKTVSNGSARSVATATSEDTIAQHSDANSVPTPPPRQTCFICDQPVPFGEFELLCASGHIQERCFLSFQVISAMDSWRCMGCGASACEIDFSGGASPFYLLESQDRSAAAPHGVGAASKISCRLCGNYCSFFKY